MEFLHVPVMLEECMEGLSLKKGGVYFDGTLGGAGHSSEILKRTSPTGKLVATDLDEEAIENAKKRLKEYEGRYSLFHSDYKDFNEVKRQSGVEYFDGALLVL